MRVTRAEDFEVYRRTLAYFQTISELTEGFTKDHWLADALRETAESMLSNIAEAIGRSLTVRSHGTSRFHLDRLRSRGRT